MSYLRRLSSRLRQEGLRAGLQALLRAVQTRTFARERWHILMLRCDGVTAAASPAGTALERLDEADLHRLLAARPWKGDGEYRKRLLDGAECYALTANGQDVHFAWVSWQASPQYYRLPVDEAGTIGHVFDCFTPVAARRRGYYACMLRQMAALASSRGIGTLWTSVASWNVSSLRGAQKAGFENVGTAVGYCLAGRHYVARFEDGAETPGRGPARGTPGGPPA